MLKADPRSTLVEIFFAVQYRTDIACFEVLMGG